MANHIQSYKSQAYMHGAVMPIALGGGSVDWGENWLIPDIAGNYSRQNATRGSQVPSFGLNYVLLDGSASTCPIHYTILNTFFTRTNDATHDVSGIAVPKFFDGYDGWEFPYCKPNGFTISCSKGELVRFQAQYMTYFPTGGADPVHLTTAIAAYNPFTGKPLSFADCSFFTGALYSTALAGVNQWSITFSNNLVPDMSQENTTGQKVYPIACNATTPTGNFSLSFTGGGSQDHIATGDTFAVRITSGSVDVKIICPNLYVDAPNSRNNQAPRIMRTYSGQCLGLNNTASGAPVYAVA